MALFAGEVGGGAAAVVGCFGIGAVVEQEADELELAVLGSLIMYSVSSRQGSRRSAGRSDGVGATGERGRVHAVRQFGGLDGDATMGRP